MKRDDRYRRPDLDPMSSRGNDRHCHRQRPEETVVGKMVLGDPAIFEVELFGKNGVFNGPFNCGRAISIAHELSIMKGTEAHPVLPYTSQLAAKAISLILLPSVG